MHFILRTSFILVLTTTAQAQRSPAITPNVRDVVQASLTAPGSRSFHLQAHLTTGQEMSAYGDIEIFWLAPDKYREVIHSKDFNQTLIVNGDDISEEDSPAYFPLGLRTLATAMLDPQPILDAVRPGDRVSTKATGDVNESGHTCLDAKKTMCFMDPNGMRETIAASGHSVEFSHYELFNGKRIARRITNAPRLGENLMTLAVTRLEDLKSPDPSLFAVQAKTPPERQLHFSVLNTDDLRHDTMTTSEIIWPQALDGEQSGPASFYISFDTSGTVKEIQQLYTVNERTNESAINQLWRWKFKPVTLNGVPAQGEGMLQFTVDTRAYGPKDSLTNEEARKLAVGIVEPVLPSGQFPPGTLYTLYVAIDADGYLIEAMPAAGSPGNFFGPCYDAIRHWRFAPIRDNGQHLPYRALISFKFP